MVVTMRWEQRQAGAARAGWSLVLVVTGLRREEGEGWQRRRAGTRGAEQRRLTGATAHARP